MIRIDSQKIGQRLGLTIVRHPRKTIAVSLLVTALFGWGASRSAFSTDYKIFFAKEDPKRVALDTLERRFTKTDNIAFVVKSQGQDVFNEDALTALHELTDAAWKLPHATRVDSLTNFQHSYAEGEDLVVEDLVERPLPQDLGRIREVAGSEPLLYGSLLARDLEAAGVNVMLLLPPDRPEAVAEAAAAARALAARVGAEHPDLEIRVSGMAMMNDAFMAASIRDMSLIFPVMALVMLVAMWLLLGSRYATFCVVAVVLVSAVATIGAGGFLGYPLTPPSAASPTIVLALAVADAVHIIVDMTARMRRGARQREAIVGSLSVNFKPVLLTSLTTMVGFLCLNFAEAAPFWHLANMTGTGIAMALLSALTLLPAMLVLVPIKPARSSAWGARLCRPLASFVLSARGPLLIGGLVATALLAVHASKLRTNDQFLEYFDDAIPFRGDTEFFMDNLTGIYTLEYQLESRDGVADPVFLQDVDRFVAWLRSQSEVVHVYALTDVLKRLNRNLAGDDPKAYHLPASEALASQQLLLYEMSLPFGLDLKDRLDVQKRTTRVTVTVSDMSSRELRAFAARSEGWLHAHAPRNMWAEAISPAIVFSHLSDRNTKAMMRGNILTLLLISICLIVALRDPGIGLLSLLPNLLPIVAAYGIWSLFVGEINIVVSVAGAVALGIIVDDTIHFLSKYQVARASGQDGTQAVTTAIIGVGPALVITTCVLFTGFGVLAFSAFQMTSALGMFTAIVCMTGLLADLLVLPPLLLAIEAVRLRWDAPRALERVSHET